MTDLPRVGNTTLAVVAAVAWMLLAFVLGEPSGNPFAMLGLLVGASFLGAGVFAWRSRPRNRVGLLMVVVGIAWLPRQIALSSDGPMIDYAISASTLWIAVIAHLMVAFPTGRVGSLVGRVVLGLVYTAAVAIALADGYLVAIGLRRDETALRSDKETFGLQAEPDGSWLQDLAVGIANTQQFAVLVLGPAVLAVALNRWRTSSSTQRRAVTPVLVAGAFAISLFVIGELFDVSARYELLLDVCMFWAFAAIPLAYLASRMRGRIDRAGVADLVVRLRDKRPTGTSRRRWRRRCTIQGCGSGTGCRSRPRTSTPMAVRWRCLHVVPSRS